MGKEFTLAKGAGGNWISGGGSALQFQAQTRVSGDFPVSNMYMYVCVASSSRRV
jgi:hypothetical protein